MKNVLFAFVLLVLLSCKKETDPTIEYSLLTQFKWQYIEPKEETLNGEKITYSDTSSYVFNDDDTFVFKRQNSRIIPPRWGGPFLRQDNLTRNGNWNLNPDEGTLTIYDADGEKILFIHSTFKILFLNKNTLKLRSVNSFGGEIIDTYSSVKK